MTKAKYYVEKKDATSGIWWAYAIVSSERKARSSARYPPCLLRGSSHVRIRHKGRTIDRWQDGRRVTK